MHEAGRFHREVITVVRLKRYAWPVFNVKTLRAGRAAGDMWRFSVGAGWFEALVGDGHLIVLEACKEIQQLPVRKRRRHDIHCSFDLPIETYRFLRGVSQAV